MNLFEFMSDSPFVTALLAYFLTELTFKLWIRAVRCINVVVRGWPPAHIDADGDWKPEGKE